MLQPRELQNRMGTTSTTERTKAIDWLLGRINYEKTAVVPYHARQLKLDRMRQLLTRLGNPDAGMKIVHVAGTKGKGSVSAMVSTVLQQAGYRTGLFSSPHIEHLEERFQLDGQPCNASELVSLINRIRPVALAMDALEGESTGPTYFEITTAIALLYFADRKVDLTVLEVGLGGRLDSTNVCTPVVSVITNISFDHTKQLGNTLEAIALEKAGIIKPGVPVVCGVESGEAQLAIARTAREHGCRLIQSEALDNGVQVGMLGKHQLKNAAVAVATLEELRCQGWSISDEAVQAGLANTKLPARVEVISQQPLVILDAAHNVASMKSLIETLAELFPHAKRTAIVSISRDKDVAGIARLLVQNFQKIVVTQYQENPRAVASKTLAAVLAEEANRTGHPLPEISVAATPHQAWSEVQSTIADDELVCITGSFFIAAELRPMLVGKL